MFSNVDQVRLAVDRYVATRSRESAEQVFMNLATTRREVEAAQQVLSTGQPQGSLLSLLDDLRLHFQKYVVESDQKQPLKAVPSSWAGSWPTNCKRRKHAFRAQVFRTD